MVLVIPTTLMPIEISSLAFFYFMAYRRFPQRLNFQRTIFRYTFVLSLVQLNTIIAYQKCMSSILAPISLKVLQFCSISVIIVCERSNSYDNKGWRTNKKRSRRKESFYETISRTCKSKSFRYIKNLIRRKRGS